MCLNSFNFLCLFRSSSQVNFHDGINRIELSSTCYTTKHIFRAIFAQISRKKSNCSSHNPIYGCALRSNYFIKKVTSVIVTHSNDLLLAFAINAADYINVVFHKYAYSLMSRVTIFPNSIVTAIVNSDAYLQSPLMNEWESMLYV